MVTRRHCPFTDTRKLVHHLGFTIFTRALSSSAPSSSPTQEFLSPYSSLSFRFSLYVDVPPEGTPPEGHPIFHFRRKYLSRHLVNRLPSGLAPPRQKTSIRPSPSCRLRNPGIDTSRPYIMPEGVFFFFWWFHPGYLPPR